MNIQLKTGKTLDVNNGYVKIDNDGKVYIKGVGTYNGTNATSGTNDVATQIDALLANKQDVLTFDTEPTEDSDNPVTSGGVYDALQNAGSSDLFIATYGTTTLAEITTAYNAGLLVCCVYNGCAYVLSSLTSTYCYFAAILSNTSKYLLLYETTWSVRVNILELTSNKTTSLSSDSSDVQYPSAKCVYDGLATKQDTLVSGTNIKTINGNDITGSGNLVISGGGSSDPTGVVSQTQTWASDYSSYTMSDIVRGSIPQMFIDLVEEVGATFDSDTGYFSFNGLTDLSYNEMKAVYVKGVPTYPLHRYQFASTDIRTNVPFRTNQTFNYASATDMGGMFIYGKMEVITLCKFTSAPSANDMPKPSGFTSSFYSNKLLREAGYWNVSSISNFANTFAYCYALQNIYLYGVKANISFSYSSRLSPASVAYMINNAGTASITITLHATAYANAMADADVQTALANKTNVTLASA